MTVESYFTNFLFPFDNPKLAAECRALYRAQIEARRERTWSKYCQVLGHSLEFHLSSPRGRRFG